MSEAMLTEEQHRELAQHATGAARHLWAMRNIIASTMIAGTLPPDLNAIHDSIEELASAVQNQLRALQAVLFRDFKDADLETYDDARWSECVAISMVSEEEEAG